MAKLYVFGIGGTGSRVIKALTMLLASGVDLKNNFNVVVPIIIDPDIANGDLSRTSDILTRYQNIYNKINGNNDLFGTRIQTLTQLTDGNQLNTTDNFKFSVDFSGTKFGDSINYTGLDEENKALIDLLFSAENIDANLTVGFKGNPNIGSIILNKIVDSPEYKSFCNTFKEDDAIFIISSIFGGTGAAGFPLLLKNLRNDNSEIVNSDKISKSVIGAISYLPYFNVADSGDEKKEIDSATFINKAKAALSYYEHSIFNNNSLDIFYHLGDKSNNNMEYATGKAEQKNDAHFLELAGALAIIDFTSEYHKISDKKSGEPCREFGVLNQNQDNVLSFDDLGVKTKRTLLLSLSKLCLVHKFLHKSMPIITQSKGAFYKGEKGINANFYQSDFYRHDFLGFLNHYTEWLTEMENNDVSFTPFHNNQDHDSLLAFIRGVETSKSWYSSNKTTGNLLIKSADEIIKKGKLDNEKEASRFIKVLDSITENHINNIIKN